MSYKQLKHTPKKTVVLEDKFGVEHLFLKGHLYNIEVHNTETHVVCINRAWNTVSFMEKDCYFLTKEQLEEHFEERYVYLAVGGQGNARFISFEYNKED